VSIELKHVSKKFGEVNAVNNVTFSVKEGELMALLGPSGGGKTTVLRMIAGLELPSAGDIFIRGERVNDIPVQKRNIGFVFQNYALFKNMTVFKNIAFGLKIKKWPRAEIEESASPSPAPSRPSPVFSCSTNPLARWMPKSARNSANGSCISITTST